MLNFSEDYFQGETREGFYVDETMKRCWAAKMEVLQLLSDICNKYGLTYFAYAGTLLGAVRHKGFIPWDDDIDIAMKRKDYQRLYEILPQELPNGFCIYDAFFDEDYNESYMHVANSDCVSISEERLRDFHGCPFIVGIDIFPLDYVPGDKKVAEELRSVYYVIALAVTRVQRQDDPAALEELLATLERCFHIKFDRQAPLLSQLWRLANSLTMNYGEEDSSYIARYSGYVENGYTNNIWEKEWYDEVVKLPFEGMTVNAPKEYHKVLRNTFGENYMTPVMYTSQHNYPFYKGQVEELRRRLEKMEKGETF